ncbi:MAG: transposase, partial [Pseudolabrys sp.]
WTKKHGRSFFGYKNHVNADAKHKLIRHYAVTDAAVHDSQELDGLLDTGNTCNDVFADSAYRSAKIESKLRASGYNSRIHRRGRRNHPLSLAQMRVNHAKSRIRARIEHVFGAQQNAPGGRIVRTIGIVRARAKVGLQNLATLETARRGMKTVESSALFQPKQRKKQGGKTIENRTQPEFVPNQASKSNIVRGAL